MTNSRALTPPARAFLALAEPAGRLDTGPHTANLLAELAQLVRAVPRLARLFWRPPFQTALPMSRASLMDRTHKTGFRGLAARK